MRLPTWCQASQHAASQEGKILPLIVDEGEDRICVLQDELLAEPGEERTEVAAGESIHESGQVGLLKVRDVGKERRRLSAGQLWDVAGVRQALANACRPQSVHHVDGGILWHRVFVSALESLLENPRQIAVLGVHSENAYFVLHKNVSDREYGSQICFPVLSSRDGRVVRD